MPEILQNITRKDLLQAIERIDQEDIPGNAHSSTYDVIYEGKPYPPKLVVSWANKFANGEELDRSSFEGGKNTDCFKLLEREGFEIVPKASLTAGQNIWLLTWNPSKWSDGGVGNTEYSLGLKAGQEVDWRCSSKQPKLGDRVFLVRTGINPKGIVAKGSVLRESFIKAAADDPSKEYNNITVAFDELRETCEEGALSSVLLKAAMPEQVWSPQSSGISIKSSLHQKCLSLWESGRGKHSLQQFVEWTETSEEHSRDEWLKDYSDYVAKTQPFVNGQQALDDDLLNLIWKPARNGVANVNPGPLSNADFEKSREVLKKLTIAVRDKPDLATYESVYAEFEKLKQEGSVRMMYRSVINRVFAGLFPAKFTSVVAVDKCKKLLKSLISDFQLSGEMGEDWYHLNQELKKCMAEANLEPNSMLRNNIAMWQLYTCIEQPNEAKADSIGELNTAYSIQKKQRGSDVLALNQILYGPPGTGKTYHTIDKALEILDPSFLESTKTASLDLKQVRLKLKQRFDELKALGRIHFVTFHQSFSYEDFVEGIKATTGSEGISYSVESGIFKKACEAASPILSGLSLDEAFNQFIEDIAEKPIVLKTPRGKEFTATYKGGNTTISCVPHSSEEKRELPASIAHIKQVLKGVRPENIYCESYVNGIANHIREELPSAVNHFQVGQSFNGYKVAFVSEDIVQLIKPNGNVLPFPMIILNELKELVESGQITLEDIGDKGWRKVESNIEPYLVNGYPNLVPLLVQHLLSGSERPVTTQLDAQASVLIIDEINRGNISSIFGELITLIEPSKRAGAEEALSVTLPYSKEVFQVPSNLYLISTMNTADRSLALMDTALRRRFDFVEMMPEPILLEGVIVKGINIKDMLIKMNKRIEVLYDREHTLGHAFFMPLIDEADDDKRFLLLQSIFSNKILPLLEEYFFEDWAKIRLVLGDKIKAPEHQFISENGKDYDTESLFGKDADLGYELEERKSYTRNDAALTFPETYLGIYEY